MRLYKKSRNYDGILIQDTFGDYFQATRTLQPKGAIKKILSYNKLDFFPSKKDRCNKNDERQAISQEEINRSQHLSVLLDLRRVVSSFGAIFLRATNFRTTTQEAEEASSPACSPGKNEKKKQLFLLHTTGRQKWTTSKINASPRFLPFFIDLTSFLRPSLSKFNLDRLKKFKILQTKFSKGTSNLKTKMEHKNRYPFLGILFLSPV